MAAELQTHYPDATIRLIPSGKGRFEVLKDDVPLFEKSKLGRHAQPGEILELLHATV